MRGRKILVAENPQLHLVWYYDRIFIKPIPLYLLSAAFWEYLVAMDNQKIHRACAGFLRTYAFLIRYETDFLQAQSSDVRLIPPKLDGSAFTYEEFATFIAPFASLGDSQVSPRFSYGELRLTRLNWLTRMFLGKLTYHHIDAQKNAYIGRIVTPFIGAFAIMTVILSAMQVELQAQSLNTDVPSQGFLVFAQVSKWFSVLVVIIVTFLVAVLIIFILFLCVHDQLFFRKVLRMKRSGRLQPPRVMTGVV